MIKVNNLCKKYGQHVALEDVSFTIESGHVYGLLGPNGAGKSTTMNILTGCLAATSGEVSIAGFDIYEDNIKAKSLIGYLPEQPPLYQDMTTWEYLDFVAEAKGVKKEFRKRQIEEVMEETGTANVRDRIIKHLSKGYKQRVGIAQALLGEPEVIILDEPTVGLDPRQIIEIRDLIKELGKNHTVILSSHILSEVRSICDYIMIISKGKLVASDTPDNLEKIFAGNATVELLVKGRDTEIQAVLSEFEEITGTTYSAGPVGEGLDDTTWVSIKTAEKEDICEKLFYKFAEKKMAIVRMNVSKANHEDIFLELTQDDKPAAEESAAEEPAKEDEDDSNI